MQSLDLCHRASIAIRAQGRRPLPIHGSYATAAHGAGGDPRAPRAVPRRVEGSAPAPGRRASRSGAPASTRVQQQDAFLCDGHGWQEERNSVATKAAVWGCSSSVDAPREAVMMMQARLRELAWRRPAAARGARRRAAGSRSSSAQLAGHGRWKQREERGT